MHALRSHRLLLPIALLALLIWLPRGLALDRFVTADEHAWLARSGNFYRALRLGDYAATFQRHHPGVTTTWAGLAGYLSTYPAYAREAPAYYGWLTEEIEPFLRSQGYDPVDVLAAGRTLVVLAITASLLVAFALSVRLLGLSTAILGLGLLALSPFHIAHSRLLHLDGLVSSFMFLALIAFLAYLQRRNIFLLVLSGFAAGLAWLTRSPALFLLPFMAAVAALAWALIPQPESRSRSAMRMAAAVLIWTLAGGLTFFLLWPAMWVDPVESVRQVLGAASEYAAEGHLKPTFFRGEVYAGDPGFSFYPVIYLWRTTPVVLLGLLLALIGFIVRRPPLDNRDAHYVIAALVLYAVGFLLFMNLGAKKFDRYLLPVYPALALVAGAGYAALGSWLRDRFRTPVARRLVPALFVVVLIVQAIPALTTFPYYLTYYNPLMGGSARAPEVMMIGWGEGADRAAHYLNTLPGAGSSTVASGYTNGPFSYFYEGTTVPIYFRHAADYAVVFAQDWQRQLPSRRAVAYYAQHQPLHVVTVDGLDYAHIYDLRTMPMPDYVTDWAGAIRLASYQLPAATISPGDSFRAIFYFANLTEIDTNLNVLVRIVGPDGGPDGQVLARSEGWPWGAATSEWQQGEVWPDGHELAIPADAEPGWYRVEVGFYDPTTQELLDATRAAGGETIGDVIALDYIRVGDLPSGPGRPMKPSADLGGVVRILGADWLDTTGSAVNPERVSLQPGQEITARLFWESLQPTAVDYTAFVHVVGPDGAPLFLLDRQPLDGFMPTSTWLPGQVVSDEFVLRLPDDAAPGEYTVHTGLYDLATMQRLPVTRNGDPAGDSVPIATLIVEATP